VVREIEVLVDAEVTLLADRRRRGPWSLQGGEDGAPGKAAVVGEDGTRRDLPGKFNVRLKKGERIRIESPGAGGWGKKDL
jgi:N-methylhydantoinase B